jgi:hypothetical protein
MKRAVALISSSAWVIANPSLLRNFDDACMSTLIASGAIAAWLQL